VTNLFEGGTKKSVAEVAPPLGVIMAICPADAPPGTVMATVFDVVLVMALGTLFRVTCSAEAEI
jgi:hypothetical protein